MSTFILLKQKILQINPKFLILVVVAVAIISHSINLFGFPAYREDEGTYMSQAWAVIEKQQLAPYTYWYDHAPGGWLFLSVWNMLSGGFDTFDISVKSGRVFMVILHVFSTVLLYYITLHITRRRSAALIAALLFSLTPLSIIFHRRVLLDNIMVFWLLLSIFLLTLHLRLRNIILSAITFAVAVLTKEIAIFFFLGMVAMVAFHTHKNNRHFALISWVSVVLLVISIYPVFALLKGEFFPSGTLLGGNQPHVSLLEAFQFQTNRGGELSLEPNSPFRLTLSVWFTYGPLFVIGGLLSTIVYLIYFKNSRLSSVALMSFLYIILLPSGEILDWYIIPILPIFALLLGAGLVDLSERLTGSLPAFRHASYGAISVALLLIVVELWPRLYIFTLPQTANQVQAIGWVKERLPQDALVLIDNYAFVDFNKDMKDITDTNIHYYWKIDTDPQIRASLVSNDWNSIDYFLFTPALNQTIYKDDLTIVREAYEKSHVVKRFNEHNILGEGYPVEIREVNNKEGALKKSWQWYKQKFILPLGQVVDPSQANRITSEGQSYALLRAVWENDKEIYDRVLTWTMINLKQKDKHLFSWHASVKGDGAAIHDSEAAADADEDIALSLLFAYKRWEDKKYLDLAKNIISDIWDHEVVNILGVHYLTAGTSSKNDRGYLINPSYFSPATYRIFAQVDTSHDWATLADDTYLILEQLRSSTVFYAPNDTHLVPNWFLVDDKGNFASSRPYVTEAADYYGYDAFRLFWRIALDNIWFNSAESAAYLKQVSPFFEKEWREKKKVSAVYTLAGAPVHDFEDISTYTGVLSTFLISQPEMAIDLYSEKFWMSFKDGYWGNPEKYYDQNWAWFATALYANNTPNLWQQTAEDTIAHK